MKGESETAGIRVQLANYYTTIPRLDVYYELQPTI